jgi:hypothetical protein
MAPTSFFIGVDHPAVGRVSVPVEVPFDLATEILPWLASVYGNILDETLDPPALRPRTPRELLRALAEGTAKGHSASVASFVRDQAVKAIATPAADVTVGEPVVE